MKNLLTLILLAVIILAGYYYYEAHKPAIDNIVTNANAAKNTAVATTTADIDAAINTGMKSIGPVSLLYYTNNRNYGISASKNICTDSTSSTSTGAIIADVQVYTKSISCVVDQNFPAKSFTIVAPSVANIGQYYCTDQNGSVVLIPSVLSGSSFKAGLSCK